METYNKDALYKKFINIYTERVPNPNSMKFVSNTMLANDEMSRDYPDAVAAQESPLAAALFAFPFTRRVFIMKNFVTLTKDERVDWEYISDEIRDFLKQYLEAEKPVFQHDTDDAQQAPPTPSYGNAHADTDTETILKIKDILEEYIKPAVEMDGGAISFHSFAEDSGTVKVLLQGSCSGCPSSTITLKAGIENLLKRMMPDQVKEVVAESV